MYFMNAIIFAERHVFCIADCDSTFLFRTNVYKEKCVVYEQKSIIK